MDLRVALCQFDMAWERPAFNLERAGRLIAGTEADLIVLPEMFATGFVPDPGRVVSSSGEIVAWMRRTARERRAAVAGSVVTADRDAYVNRMLLVAPSGETTAYDKRHLFSIGGEGGAFRAGSRRVVVEYGGWRLLLLVCYDLRFPVWSRCRGDYDALVCVASWPEPRREVWRTLLRARAIENQAYAIGVNRVGTDPENRYAGDSAVIDFQGRTLVELSSQARVATVRLEHGPQEAFRRKFPAWRDADDFRITGI